MASGGFMVVDYVVLATLLALSVSIGVWVAWLDRRRQSSRHFLTARGQLGWLPVSLSMMASFFSSVNVLGLPAQVFMQGSLLWTGVFATSAGVLLSAYVFLPVYHSLNVTSINEYLEKRFNSTLLRNVASGLFILQTVMYTGVALYGPSLAVSSVTGLSVWSSIVMNGLACTFYTNIGGLKAVVWTDAVQMILIYASYFLVITAGVLHVGGFGNMITLAEEGGRVKVFDWNLSPYQTFTSWSLLLSWSVRWCSAYCASQTQVQRISSLPSAKLARRAVLFNLPAAAITTFLPVLAGLALVAVYKDCDPRLTGDIKKPDELMPYIVQDLMGKYPGLSGLLVASVFSGSLSTLSSGYNSMAAVTWEDLIRPRVKLTDTQSIVMLKCVGTFYGFLSIAVAFLVGSLKSIMQASTSLLGVTSGPLLAIFLLGVLAPCCKKTGALAGMLTGLFVASWLVIGSIVYPRPVDQLPSSTAGCSSFNETLTLGSLDPPPTPSGLNRFYHISFMWTHFVGFATSLVTSLVVSLIFDREGTEEVDAKYLSPMANRFSGRHRKKGANIQVVWEPEKDKASTMELEKLVGIAQDRKPVEASTTN
nr:sodium-coupled monocarboxylate transporter 2-like [Rhipicephalus microplus]